MVKAVGVTQENAESVLRVNKGVNIGKFFFHESGFPVDLGVINHRL